MLVKLKEKKHREWKQGQVRREEYGDEVWFFRVRVGKATVKLKLNLARKISRKGFYRNVKQKRKVREGECP